MTKQRKIEQLEAKVEKLRKMLVDEREKVARYEDGEGYEGVYRIQNAYIAVLLSKMGATEEKPVPIINDEITEAMDKLEVRALIGDGGGWKFYVEGLKE